MVIQAEVTWLCIAKHFLCPDSMTVDQLKKKFSNELKLINPDIRFFRSMQDSSLEIIEKYKTLRRLSFGWNILKLSASIDFPEICRVKITVKAINSRTFRMNVYPDLELFKLRKNLKNSYWSDHKVELLNCNGKTINLSKKISHLLLKYGSVNLNVCLVRKHQNMKKSGCTECSSIVVDDFASDIGITNPWPREFCEVDTDEYTDKDTDEESSFSEDSGEELNEAFNPSFSLEHYLQDFLCTQASENDGR